MGKGWRSKGSADLLFKVRGYRLRPFTCCPPSASRLNSLHVAIASPLPLRRYFFVTVALLKSRRRLHEPDFERLAYAPARMRRKHGFLLTGWVFLPDHWHAIIYPPYPLSISRVFQAVKVSSMVAINVRLGEAGELWQGRFFDRALRTVKEYHAKVEYIPWNPVRRGLVKRMEEWKWSSLHEYAGVRGEEQERQCGLRIGRVRLPADENTRI